MQTTSGPGLACTVIGRQSWKKLQVVAVSKSSLKTSDLKILSSEHNASRVARTTHLLIPDLNETPATAYHYHTAVKFGRT